MSGRVRGLTSLRRKLGLISEGEERVARIEVKRASVNVQNGGRRRVSVDRGHLRNSVTHQIRRGGLQGVTGTNLEYGPAVEFGSRPHFPPLEPIRAWAKRKGIPEGAAFAIALKIAREGTPAQPFLFPAFEEERPKFLRRLERALNAELRRVSR